MDEFRYGDWLLVLGGAWLGFKSVVAFIQILVSRPTYCLPASPSSPADHVYPAVRRENAGDNGDKGDAGDNGGAALNGDTT